MTSPVRFSDALNTLLRDADRFDLLIEVGPGVVLSHLAREITDVPVISLDAGGTSLTGLLQVLGAAFVLGAPCRPAALFSDRFTRPFTLDWNPKFFTNPCELAPVLAEPETSNPCPCPSSKTTDRTEPRTRTQDNSGGSVQESGSPIEIVRRLVAERAQLPAAVILDEHRMLGDLHLSSISVGQLVSDAARQLGLARVMGLTEFANASVAQVARALAELKRTNPALSNERKQSVLGVDTWVRAFSVEWVETKLPQRPAATNHYAAPGSWRIFTPKDHPLESPLREELAASGVSGVAVCLPENPNEDHAAMLLDAGRAVAAMTNGPRFLMIQQGSGGGGFARTLQLEMPGTVTRVISVPPSHPRAAEWIAAEAQTAAAFAEVRFTDDGRRLEPRLKLAEFSPSTGVESCPGPDDVMLVTGGGKGIAAECALALARETGVRLALIGRSDPNTDQELAHNLARVSACGVRFVYVRADIADAAAVRNAVADIERALGMVTGVLHGAGVNTPQLITSLNEETFRRTLSPKVRGARNVLASIKTEHLRFLVVFSSIIARIGLPGEADYAAANEWLTALTEEFQSQHPRCRSLALEWSVWSGAGMGERLGRIESLLQRGITPISTDEGVRVFCDLIRGPKSDTALVVTGRFGKPPTLKLAGASLPLQRFLEREQVYYPGVELVVDAQLSVSSDPYLDDHIVQRRRIFPAVFGLEAMAQAAMALAGSKDPPVFENVEFVRPVTVPDKAALTIRLAALRRETGLVEVCLRSEETDFQATHFRAVCRFGGKALAGAGTPALFPAESDRVSLDPPRDLYGRILFHGDRFHRVKGYRLLNAKECVAEIAPADGISWFGSYLPAGFVLGDPASRDAALHAIQACIPHRRILPAGIDRLTIVRIEAGARCVRAKERCRDGDTFIYDLEIMNSTGELIEHWEGLRLRALELMPPREPWPDGLLAPYLERRLEELTAAASVNIAFGADAGRDRPTNGALLRRTGAVWHRPDGKPVTTSGEIISAAHSQHLTLSVANDVGVACDLETVEQRPPAVWRDLLGEGDFNLAGRIARECPEDIDTAATRLWATRECLKKIGLPVDTPVVMDTVAGDGWVLFRAGRLTVATCVAEVRGRKNSLMTAVAVESATPAMSATPTKVRT
jgi:enediyne polyketide synthase